MAACASSQALLSDAHVACARQVRSLTLDVKVWNDAALLDMMRNLGNNVCNDVRPCLHAASWFHSVCSCAPLLCFILSAMHCLVALQEQQQAD